MRDLVNLRIPVNAWNAVKFLVEEAVVSLVFAPLWNRYILSKCYTITKVEQNCATLFASEIGRFTPASVMAYRTDAALSTPHRTGHVHAKKISQGVLLFVNVLLLSSLLLTEYGSGSTSAYEEIKANVTDVRKHNALVQTVLKWERSTAALTPLLLEPQDYDYIGEQHLIDLNVRVRSLRNPSRTVSIRNAAENHQKIEVCGVSPISTRCDDFNAAVNSARGRNKSNSFNFSLNHQEAEMKIFRMQNFTVLSDKFENAADWRYITTDVQEVGQGFALHAKPKSYKMDCIIHHFEVVGANYHTYQLDYCVTKVGKYVHFVLLENMLGEYATALLAMYPQLSNQTGVRYSLQRIYHRSVFGIESGFIYSRDVALFQFSTLDASVMNYKHILGQSEIIYMDYLKERILWALIGMVSGNSEVKTVAVKTNVELATLNELFIAGSLSILLILLLLLICGSRQGSGQLNIPVDSAHMLHRIRDADGSKGEVLLSSSRQWPELCVTRETDATARLSFSGGEPLSIDDFPSEIK